MALIHADRVLEHCQTAGTGPYGLAGPLASYRAASGVCADGDTFEYFVEPVDGSSWETGLGTWRTGNVVERTAIYDSSSGGLPINWPAGEKYFAMTVTAVTMNGIIDRAALLQTVVHQNTIDLAALLDPYASHQNYTASSALSGHRMVALADAGQVALANNSEYAHAVTTVGITLNAAASGASISVKSGGPIEFAGWSWTPGQRVFLGASGSMSQAPTGGLFTKALGFAITPTLLMLDIQPAIFFN